MAEPDQRRADTSPQYAGRRQPGGAPQQSTARRGPGMRAAPPTSNWSSPAWDRPIRSSEHYTTGVPRCTPTSASLSHARRALDARSRRARPAHRRRGRPNRLGQSVRLRLRAVRVALRRSAGAGRRYHRRPIDSRRRSARRRSRVPRHPFDRPPRKPGRQRLSGGAGRRVDGRCETVTRVGGIRPACWPAALNQAEDSAPNGQGSAPASTRTGCWPTAPRWSAGHSVSGVLAVTSVRDLVAGLTGQYAQARAEP